MTLLRTLAPLVSLVGLLALASCSSESPEAPSATVEEIAFRVPSMHCGGCEEAIESTVARLEGVVSCEADFETGAVTVVVDGGDREAAVIAAVEAMEYEVER